MALTTAQKERLLYLVEQDIIEPTTDAELDERRRLGKGRDRIRVTVNQAARIGALHLIRDRDEIHDEVAVRFKAYCEAFYGSGLGASDTTREPVDTSFKNHDSGMAATIDNYDRLGAAINALSKADFNAVYACVYLNIPPGEQVHHPSMSDRQFRAARAEKSKEIKASLETIGEVWNLKTKRKAA